MLTLPITTALLGLGLASLILVLLRRDHLYVYHAMFWLLVALLAAVLGLMPGTIDTLAKWLGIVYPPAALLLLACLALFIKALYADITNTRLERQLRRLNQRIAIVEARSQAEPTHAP